MKKTVWSMIALIAVFCIGICALAGCGKNADSGENKGSENHASENAGDETEKSAAVTIGDETFMLKNETELYSLHYLENYVDFNTDRVGNTKLMSYNYDGAFSFEVRVNCEEEHSFDEVKALMSEYEETTKEVNGITYTYYAYKNDLGDDAHYYMYEYENKTYSIIFFLGENPGNIEEVFMNNVRFE